MLSCSVNIRSRVVPLLSRTNNKDLGRFDIGSSFFSFPLSKEAHIQSATRCIQIEKRAMKGPAAYDSRKRSLPCERSSDSGKPSRPLNIACFRYNSWSRSCSLYDLPGMLALCLFGKLTCGKVANSGIWRLYIFLAERTRMVFQLY